MQNNISINVHIPIEVFVIHTLGRHVDSLFWTGDRARPASSQFPIRSFLPKTKNVWRKSLTVICKQFKQAANVFLRIHTTRQQNQIEKEEQTTTTTVDEQLETTKRNTAGHSTSSCDGNKNNIIWKLLL